MSPGLNEINNIFLVCCVVIFSNDEMARQSAKMCFDFLQDLINTLRRYILLANKSLILDEFEMFFLKTK